MNVFMYTPQADATASEHASFADRLVGVWSLVTYSDEHEDCDDTQPFGPNPQGFLIYTADGFVSAQLMKPGRPAFHSADWHNGTLQEYEVSGSGYIAYCGSYEVDEVKATVTHIPSVSLLPNLIDGRQCRSIHLQGDRLVLRAARAPVAGGLNVTSRLEWKRITRDVEASI
jgi:Lipocalin-like domain